MHKYSQKAASFVVVAEYSGEDSGVRSFTVGADTPVREIFERLWPTEGHEILAGSPFAMTPMRIEITPDEGSIPHVEEPGLFGKTAEH